MSVGLLATPATALAAIAGEVTEPAAVAGTGVIINEAYVNGGSAGAPFGLAGAG